MSDANSANEHEHATNEQREQWLSVREAAEVLGIGIRAVQQRVSRGKIPYKRDGERLLICLNFTSSDVKLDHEQHEQEATNSEQPANEQATNSTNTALIDALQADVAFLRSQLEQRDVAESELRRLLLSRDREVWQLREQLSITASVEASPVPATVPTEDSESRLNATHNDGIAQDVETPAEPKRRGIWARLFGPREG